MGVRTAAVRFAHKLESTYKICKLSSRATAIAGTCITVFVQSRFADVREGDHSAKRLATTSRKPIIADDQSRG